MAAGNEIASQQSKLAERLHWLIPQLQSSGEAVRWACLMEATAPKAGNVFPGQRFSDLTYCDFVLGADIAAEAFMRHERFGHAIAHAAERIRESIGTNVNLGILLLMGPLFQADKTLQHLKISAPTFDDWMKAIKVVFEEMEQAEEAAIFHAISISAAGGLGRVKKWDVHDPGPKVDLLEAMKDAAGRDRVARQYAGGYLDFFDNVVPSLIESILEAGDLLAGIVNAQLKLLSRDKDTLISRKNGTEVSENVRAIAARVQWENLNDRMQFDSFLREDGNRLNPGTTADLIAAALFIVFRSLPESRTHTELV